MPKRAVPRRKPRPGEGAAMIDREGRQRAAREKITPSAKKGSRPSGRTGRKAS